MPRDLWNRNEMILALNLYLKLPFGQMHARNEEVIKLAHLIGRTPNAVALRLVNYASYDPNLKQRGILGMSHGRKVCENYWDEFSKNKEQLIYESERILATYEGTTIEDKYACEIQDIPKELKGEMKVRQVMMRVNQRVFRQMVLSNFDGKCALTGIDISELLIASHIIPWASNEQERLNPKNGICLSSLFDKAFDQGLISFTDDYKLILSARLKANVGKEYYTKYFDSMAGKQMALPRKYSIEPTFLEWHREYIFNK